MSAFDPLRTFHGGEYLADYARPPSARLHRCRQTAKGRLMTQGGIFERTVANARRLYSDSKLLADNNRAHSAIILGVLAIEEFGKALIGEWGVKNLANKREHPTHIEKQTALFILLSSKELLTKKGKRLIFRGDREDFDFRKVGPFSEQFAWARAGFFDDIRMAATYADRQPKIPADISSEFDTGIAHDLHKYFEAALKTSKNAKAMGLASEIYKNGLGRL